ncbi:hypothetical protein AVEN_8337-1 [Araneus ventricosus]|uniref:Uncharacterized protein n=1 Tax=Araneus ventricosus TaxID=182803 RepID=A0A4Y2UMK6_ARAVE|nr:hypothetical protein AVEN_8337-1 [Araneus ventricosus]
MEIGIAEWQYWNIKQDIHISSKMEFLEHGKGEKKRRCRKPVENSIANGKVGFPTKPNAFSSCTEFLVGSFARLVCTSNDLTRSRPCYEGSKSEIRGVGEGMVDRRTATKGKEVCSPLLPAQLGISDEWTCLISRLE